MKIVADEGIPHAKEAFESLGEVRILRGRETGPDDVKDADIIFVRSVTKVDKQLLDGSKVRLVATATIGIDHIDETYLRKRNIRMVSAPGSNANAVAEYVVAVLMDVYGRAGKSLEGSSIAVFGVGNVGSRVAAYAGALGMKVFLNDPPLARHPGDNIYMPLDEVIGCDVVTLHVPLTREGEDATFHLVDETVLRKMSPGALLINASRGAVVDGNVLLKALEAGRLKAVLDVWEGEPNIDIKLMRRTELATPHIAGYSLDAKVNGTTAVYREVCAFLGIEPSWDPARKMPTAEVPDIGIECYDRSEEDIIREAVSSIYDIQRDNSALRKIQDLPAGERGSYFEKLRREYRQRREFFNTTVNLRHPKGRASEKISALGFKGVVE